MDSNFKRQFRNYNNVISFYMIEQKKKGNTKS